MRVDQKKNIHNFHIVIVIKTKSGKAALEIQHSGMKNTPTHSSYRQYQHSLPMSVHGQRRSHHL